MLINRIIFTVVDVGIWLLLFYVAYIVFMRFKKVYQNLKTGQPENKYDQYSLKETLDCLDTADKSEEELRQYTEGEHSLKETELRLL